MALPANHATGQTITAADVNAIETAVNALNGTSPLLTPASAVILGNSWSAANFDANSDYGDRGWGNWFQALTGHRFDLLNSAGVSGERIDQFTARVATAVTPYAPGWVFLDGPTNDISQGYSLATIQTNFLALLTALEAAGVGRIVCYTVAPNNTNDAAKNAVKDQWNDWLRRLPFSRTASLLRAQIIVAEVHDALVTSTTNTFLAGLTYDGTHPNPDGALLTATAIADAVTPYLPGSLPRVTAGADSLNILGAAGSFVTPTAGLAASWSQAGTGTPTTVARTDNVQGNWQQIVIPNGNTSTQLYSRPSGWAAGDVFKASVELWVDALGDAASAFPYYGLRLTALGGANPSVFALSSSDGSTRRTLLPGRKLILRTPALTIPASGTTNLQIGLLSFGGGTFRWGRARLYKPSAVTAP